MVTPKYYNFKCSSHLPPSAVYLSTKALFLAVIESAKLIVALPIKSPLFLYLCLGHLKIKNRYPKIDCAHQYHLYLNGFLKIMTIIVIFVQLLSNKIT